jgi:hypothetical protein
MSWSQKVCLFVAGWCAFSALTQAAEGDAWLALLSAACAAANLWAANRRTDA